MAGSLRIDRKEISYGTPNEVLIPNVLPLAHLERVVLMKEVNLWQLPDTRIQQGAKIAIRSDLMLLRLELGFGLVTVLQQNFLTRYCTFSHV